MPNDGNGKLYATVIADNGNDIDVIRVTDIVFLKYMSEGIMKSGMLSVDFVYSSSLSIINYLDVQYGDQQIEKYVEGNPNVLRNIDSYLRNNLLFHEYNIK